MMIDVVDNEERTDEKNDASKRVTKTVDDDDEKYQIQRQEFEREFMQLMRAPHVTRGAHLYDAVFGTVNPEECVYDAEGAHQIAGMSLIRRMLLETVCTPNEVQSAIFVILCAHLRRTGQLGDTETLAIHRYLEAMHKRGQLERRSPDTPLTERTARQLFGDWLDDLERVPGDYQFTIATNGRMMQRVPDETLVLRGGDDEIAFAVINCRQDQHPCLMNVLLVCAVDEHARERLFTEVVLPCARERNAVMVHVNRRMIPDYTKSDEVYEETLISRVGMHAVRVAAAADGGGRRRPASYLALPLDACAVVAYALDTVRRTRESSTKRTLTQIQHEAIDIIRMLFGSKEARQMLPSRRATTTTTTAEQQSSSPSFLEANHVFMQLMPFGDIDSVYLMPQVYYNKEARKRVAQLAAKRFIYENNHQVLLPDAMLNDMLAAFQDNNIVTTDKINERVIKKWLLCDSKHVIALLSRILKSPQVDAPPFLLQEVIKQRLRAVAVITTSPSAKHE